MAIDLNQDMGELVKNLFKSNKPHNGSDSSKSGTFGRKIKPYLNSILIFIIIISASVAYKKLHYDKMNKSNLEKKEEVDRLNDLKVQTAQLDARLKNVKKDLGDSHKKYIQDLSHFGNSEDLGELYQSISILADKYNLTVLNIKELPMPAPPAEPINKKNKVKSKKKEKIKVKEVKVKVELKGSYVRYIQFKEDLSIAEMLLKVNKENIAVKTEEKGKIQVTLELITYAIDKKSLNGLTNYNLDNKEKIEDKNEASDM